MFSLKKVLFDGVRPFLVINIRAMMLAAPTIKPSEFECVEYTTKDKVAYIKLNRPDRLNAIGSRTPLELQQSVLLANSDENVKVIVLSGNGRAFCSGYDLIDFAETERGGFASQKMPWDPFLDYKLLNACTEAFMSLWKSFKPTVCKIHGFAVAGGSDIALCCDMVIMGDNAKIGYPPARVWGCPTPAMWVYRLGAEKAKRMLFTGDLITGKEAAKMGLVLESVPEDELDGAVDKLVQRMVNVPSNQLFFQKQVINQAVEQMGLASTQRLATFIDGMTRHTPEGVMFQKRAFEAGFKQAVKERDSGEETAWSGPSSKL